MFYISPPLRLASSFRPQSGGWDLSAARARWGAPYWSLTWCRWWLRDRWWELLLWSARESHLVPEEPNYFPLQRQVSALHRNPFPTGCPQHWFFQWGVNHALEGPANCSSGVRKQPLGRQLLPLKGYQVCSARSYTILLGMPWENIVAQAFIGDHSFLPIY